ncbi:MAG: hypothetical protein LBF57_01930 [Holosporaceae bacterium]|jgi:hypothetical protein|nr:hypothetical protein [Holosporaceae bacterium]
MGYEDALIAVICHDLITPFNAISIGVEAFELSHDWSLLESIKESSANANSILCFIRELYSVKSDDFSYSVTSLNQTVSKFLEFHHISLKMHSNSENVIQPIGKIAIYNAAIAKGILPMGGEISINTNCNNRKISTTYSGEKVVPPNIENTNNDYRNVMLVGLLKFLNEFKFTITIEKEESHLIITAQG